MEAAIRMENIEKSFRGPGGSVAAVRRLDLTISSGETVALLGPNGAGKSTSLDILLGLTRPDRGSVSVLGRNAREAVEGGLVGAMLQTGMLIRDVSVREVVEMVRSLHRNPLGVDEALELAGVCEIASQRTNKLSGGQAQRVRLALAVCSDPELLVLDEPTVGLDVESRRSFWRTMRAFASRGKTVILATHYLEEADAYADRAVLMAEGLVVADGPTTEIRACVGRRQIRATVDSPDEVSLERLPGVETADLRGDVAVLDCSDSDIAIRELLGSHPEARDIEIATPGLEDAFLELTRADAEAADAGLTLESTL